MSSFIPFVLNGVVSERDQAAALATIGIGQAEMSAMQVNDRGDASKNLGGTALGGSGAVAVNPMVPSASSLPGYVQPNPPAPGTTAVPPGNSNPMAVGASPNYQQPGTGNPQPNPSGQASRSNPMGL